MSSHRRPKFQLDQPLYSMAIKAEVGLFVRMTHHVALKDIFTFYRELMMTEMEYTPFVMEYTPLDWMKTL